MTKMHHIECEPGSVGKYVILPGDPKRCEIIAAYLDQPRLVADKREYVTYTGTLDGEMVSVTSTGIGGPSASIAMEELVMLGADTFIRVGTCGGMQEDVRAGDLVIPNGAIRMDGTGNAYCPIEFPAVPNFELLQHLVAAAQEQKFAYHVGVCECKDSYYGQHDPNRMPVAEMLNYRWNAWKKAGALASEMESATLYIVAATLNVRCATILKVANNQIRAEKGLENTPDFNTEDAIAVAITAMRRTIAAS